MIVYTVMCLVALLFGTEAPWNFDPESISTSTAKHIVGCELLIEVVVLLGLVVSAIENIIHRKDNREK